MIRGENMRNIVSDETRRKREREREREREMGIGGLGGGYEGPKQAIHCLLGRRPSSRSDGRSFPHSENIVAMKALEGEKR